MTDPSLRDLQRWMKAKILSHAEETSTAPASPRFNHQRGTPGEERLAVYASGYLARTREALSEAYPAIRHLVGESAFDALARAYAGRYSSHDYNLSLVGRHLPEFLLSAPLREALPFLPDVARLEWAVSQAFHAFDQPPRNVNPLASLSLERGEGARLIFQPSVQVIASSWPILDLWQARTQPREQIDIPVRGRPQRVLVARRDFHVRCELIEEQQRLLLESLLGGGTLGAACAALTAQSGGETLPLSDWFARWVADGLIIGFRSLESSSDLC